MQETKGKLGEEFINEIAYRSFLKYWCYPNPKDEKGDKKEICDLLIMFKDTIIIICVKNKSFQGKYDKYFRKTIEKDIRQVNGAERKILCSEGDIFIKHPDKPIEKINTKGISRVLRVVVHLGDGVQFYPILDLSKNGNFVNIFDKETFNILVTELDTMPDFIEYLDKREKAFKGANAIILPKDEFDFDEKTAVQFFDYDSNNQSNGKSIIISGTESDLLAYYLINNRQFLKHISSKKYNHLSIQIDGKWDEFIKNKQLIAKKKDDKASYFIDDFVKKEILSSPTSKSIKIAQELLSFSRFERRTISKSFLGFCKQYENIKGYNFARRFGEINGTGIVFVFYSLEMKENHVNQLLSLAMDSFYIFNKYTNNKMILIGTTNKMRQFKYGLMENRKPFDNQTEKLIMEEVKKLGWFSNLQYIKSHESEYPIV